MEVNPERNASVDPVATPRLDALKEFPMKKVHPVRLFCVADLYDYFIFGPLNSIWMSFDWRWDLGPDPLTTA